MRVLWHHAMRAVKDCGLCTAATLAGCSYDTALAALPADVDLHANGLTADALAVMLRTLTGWPPIALLGGDLPLAKWDEILGLEEPAAVLCETELVEHGRSVYHWVVVYNGLVFDGGYETEQAIGRYPGRFRPVDAVLLPRF